MTPKEKAIELYNRYEIPQITKFSRKQCVFICIDEILRTISGAEFLALERFWNEVKKEIEEL